MAVDHDPYSVENYERCLARGTRPNGRTLCEARPANLGFGAVLTAEGSALVKIGNTTMLAGVKLEVMKPTLNPNEGLIEVMFETPALCSGSVRPVRQKEQACSIGEQVTNAIHSAGLIDKKELCIVPALSAWKVYVDVYCLDADGSLLDGALLAAVAALSNLRIPRISVDNEGKVVSVADQDKGVDARVRTQEEVGKVRTLESKKLTLGPCPFGLTCGEYLSASPTTCTAHKEGRVQSASGAKRLAYGFPITGPLMASNGAGWETQSQGPIRVTIPGEDAAAVNGMRVDSRSAAAFPPARQPSAVSGRRGYFVVDPIKEEEALMKSVVTVIVDERGHLISVYKLGGRSEASIPLLQDCIEAASKRAAELRQILDDACKEAEETLEE
ncbi:hypothetical protein CBR_g20981 [Chara braunii]|uniref:Ribosomal RNA-processing protein 43 n=1 Tax=Chara braunii TaxID=69332 RepID=A0A388L087_CHABU|nr:hypothetical protein CBR_g20981 [Chara braunii]|eukprot:GBG75734.1 hypothetical protein CBR_g20981 [Chara braunii]